MADSRGTSVRERYPGTNRTRPKELTGGGRGDYCCIPECCNARYNKQRKNENWLVQVSDIGSCLDEAMGISYQAHSP